MKETTLNHNPTSGGLIVRASRCLFGRRTRRLEADLEAVKADRERIRGERDQFAKDRDAFKAAAETAAHKFAVADDANKRLEGRNRALSSHLEAVQQVDRAGEKEAADRIAELMAQYRAEKRRADRLQAQYDEAAGLTPSGIRDSGPWQPGYKQPQPDKEVSA